MKSNNEQHLAYVIHSRAFRETSLLVDMLSLEHGRIALVARGAKRGKLKTSSLLQPFIPLSVSWFGTGDLVTLTQVEMLGVRPALSAKRMICGLYINELLFKLLNKWDPCLNLFNSYQQALLDLSQEEISEQVILRKFEKEFLKSLGYGLQLRTDVSSGEPIQADSYYKFDPVHGPSLVSSTHFAAVKGASLLALELEDFTCPEMMTEIKRLMRVVFSHHLGARQLMTRQLL